MSFLELPSGNSATALRSMALTTDVNDVLCTLVA